MKRPKKPKLPKYVVTKFDPPQWYVRRSFPTVMRDKNGHIIYTQIVRRCFPHTAERAREVSDEIERMVHAAEPPPPDERTVDEFIDTVLSAKQGSISPRTYDDYQEMRRRYLDRTALASAYVTTVSPMMIQTFYTGLQAKGVSGSMVRKLHTMLSMCFNQGTVWGVLTRNPCRGVILPRPNDKEIEVMREDEARSFMKTCLAEPEFLVLAFALETGMRPGEYLALRWSEVDLARSTIKVLRAVAFGRNAGYAYKEPKTKHSRRTISISPQMREALVAHRERQRLYEAELKELIKRPLQGRTDVRGVNYARRKSKRDQARRYLAAVKEHDLVFPSQTGTPISSHNLGVRTMTAACKRAGIPRYSLYALRHSCVTLLLAHGANIRYVSEKIGHSSTNVTWEVYSHVLPRMRDDAMEKLVEALYAESVAQ